MATINISGLGPYDGSYPLDLTFNFRDFHEIKKITGIRANEVMEALEAGDLDVVVALASIALRRAGKTHDPDVLFDAAIGGIEMVFDDEEVESADDPTTSGNGKPTDISDAASGSDSSPATGSSPETSQQSGSGTPQPDSTSSPEALTT